MVVVCETKTYFPPEPKTDTTAKKKFLQHPPAHAQLVFK
jgi:hypothetical protein